MADVTTESGLLGSRINYHAIFSGVIVTLALQLLMTVLGNAIGISLMDPAVPGGVRAETVGPICWTLLIPIATFFFGGLTAAMVARANGARGALHGLIVWGLCTLFLAGLLALSAHGVAAAAAHMKGGDYWLAFFSDCLALFGALVGSSVGAASIRQGGFERGYVERRVTP